MGYDGGASFPLDFEPNGIPFGSKSKGKLAPRSYPIQCERKWHACFLSVCREARASQTVDATFSSPAKTIRPDWKFCNPSSERRMPLSIMGAQWRAPLKPLGTILT